MQVLGVVTKGRMSYGPFATSGKGEWVTRYRVSASRDSHHSIQSWFDVDHGRTFQGNDEPDDEAGERASVSHSTQHPFWQNTIRGTCMGYLTGSAGAESLFHRPVRASFVRIHPMAWNNHIALRAAALLSPLVVPPPNKDAMEPEPELEPEPGRSAGHALSSVQAAVADTKLEEELAEGTAPASGRPMEAAFPESSPQLGGEAPAITQLPPWTLPDSDSQIMWMWNDATSLSEAKMDPLRWTSGSPAELADSLANKARTPGRHQGAGVFVKGCTEGEQEELEFDSPGEATSWLRSNLRRTAALSVSK